MSDQIFQFRVLFSGPDSRPWPHQSGSSHLARDDFKFYAVAIFCSLLHPHIISPASDSGCRSAAVRYELTERGRVESSQRYLCLAIATAGRGDRRGKESMAFVRLFRILFCFLLSASASARLEPLIEEFRESRAVVDIFDTSNYGKLQLNNGLARTPQMGSVSEIPLFAPFCLVLHGLCNS